MYNMVGYSILYYFEGEDFAASAWVHTDTYTAAHERDGDFAIFKTRLTTTKHKSTESYQSIEGKLELDGKAYNMVSQKVNKDTLYVLCRIDDNARYRFMELADHVAKHVKEPIHPTKKGQTLLKNFLKEYTTLHRKHLFYVLEWTVPCPETPYFPLIPTGIHTTWSPPPRLA